MEQGSQTRAEDGSLRSSFRERRIKRRISGLEYKGATGVTNKPQGQRSTSTRSNSETDIVYSDEEYNKMIETMSEKDVNVTFEELLRDMNLNDDKKKPLRNMSLYKKKAILVMQNKRKSHQETGNRFNEPEDHKYLEYLINSEYTQLYKFQDFIESLRIALAHEPLSWVEQFGSIGLQNMLQVLEIGLEYKDAKLQTECLRCLGNFVNDTTQLEVFLYNKGHETVAKCLDHEKPQVMLEALKILAALCYQNEGGDDEGSKKVLMAITKVGEMENRERFLPFVNGIIKTNNAELQDAKLQTECLRCLGNFVNDTTQLEVFLYNKGHETVAKCLDHEKPQVMLEALKILAALCYQNEGGDDEGCKKVLMAITKVGEMENRERFLPFVNGIIKTNNAELQGMCFLFINALLSETEDFELRMHLRNEIVRNGLYKKLHELKNETDPMIKMHFDTFENQREDDVYELHERFDNVRLDIDDMQDCFEILKNVTKETPSEPHFLSILQHLLFIRNDVNIRLAYFKLIEEIISQIVLHKSGLDSDFKKSHIDINLQPLLDELKDKPSIVVDSAEVEGLKKQLEEALAVKTEAEARLDPVQTFSDKHSIMADSAEVGNLKKQLEEALAAKTEAESKLDLVQTFSDNPSIVVDSAKVENLKKQLEEALAAKTEAESKLHLVQTFSDKPSIVVDSAEVDNLKRQLEEALVSKTEAEAKLDLVQGRLGAPDNSNKLDPALLNKIKVNVAPPPSPPSTTFYIIFSLILFGLLSIWWDAI